MVSLSYVTGSGVEVPAVTADQMREVDRIAIEETGPNLYQMMENAGRNLASMTIRLLGPGWRDDTIVVLAGTGGNGGGGICGARHLANHGGEVTVVVSDQAGLRPVPADSWRHIGEPMAGSSIPMNLAASILCWSSMLSSDTASPGLRRERLFTCSSGH